MIGAAESWFIPEPTYGIPGNWIGRKPENGGNQVQPMENISPCLTKTDRHGVAAPIGTDHYNLSITGEVAATMGTAGSSETKTGPTALVQTNPICFEANMSLQQPSVGDVYPTITRRTHASVCLPKMAVRRLTPVECERLQGFPDGYTDIKPKGKATPDGPRYKALGNSMAVPVMKWIGERIQQVEELTA
jgi:DNA (cytosine-5)-methyltransferase 1